MTKFLLDEVRSGFYIPTAIKQAWAVQLKILSEIDRICSKYNIKYFADWGTYLGAVRHGGFVPWDDDLDICMLREDYEKFKQAAKSELPEGYGIHNFETKENHWLFLARVVNTDSICFDKKFLDENYNFPYIATVDIFILDYLYEDEKEEKRRCEEVKHIIALADGIVQGSVKMEAMNTLIAELEDKYGLRQGSLYAGKGEKAGAMNKNAEKEERREIGIALYQLAEKQMGRTPKDKSNRIGQIFPWVLKGSRGLPKEYYEKSVRLPFEFTTIPVPAYYHKGLQGRYGEYMRVHKIWGGHDYPYFEGQRANLQAVADFKLPEFTFKPEMLRENREEIDKSASLKNMAAECLAELENMVGAVCGGLSAEKLDVLAGCQQLAVDLGTLVEEVKGERREGTIAVVKSLEEFCEAVYGLYMYVQENAEKISSGGDACEAAAYQKNLSLALALVEEKVGRYVINRKEVLFVLVGDNRWSGFKLWHDLAAADENTDVYVVNVPVMRKDAYGNVITEGEAYEQITIADNSKCVSQFAVDWRTFSLELHMPDEIYIQDEYDRENPCLTVPEMYYAENLQRYTDKLIFVPPFEVNEFKKEDSTDWYNMKHYVTAPGVVRADAVIAQSENMRRNYVERLTEFAGENTREIWEKKISTAENFMIESGNRGDSVSAGIKDRKRMMYCIGLNELTEHRDGIIEAVLNRLEVIKKSGTGLEVRIGLYPPDKELWFRAEPGLSKELFDEVKSFVDENINFSCAGDLESLDAYYGSPTPYAHYLNMKGKPVMLCDYSI